MKAESFKYEIHAERIEDWGGKNHFPLPPKRLLPDVGFIVNDSACGFLYTTNSGIGWCEWVFSNPKKPKNERAEALDILFQLIEAAALKLKIELLFSAASFPAYQSIFERNGFEQINQNVTHFIKKIGGDSWTQ